MRFYLRRFRKRQLRRVVDYTISETAYEFRAPIWKDR
jgi:hypothetical protein